MKISRKQLRKLIESHMINEWGEIGYSPELAPKTAGHISQAKKAGGFTAADAGEVILGMLPVTGNIMNAKSLGEALYEIYETGGDEGKMKAVFAAAGLVLPAVGKVGGKLASTASRLGDVHSIMGALITVKDKSYNKKNEKQKKKIWKEISDDLIAKNPKLKNKVRPA